MKKYLSLIAIMALMVTYAMAQAPVYTGIPDVKLYAGKSLSSAFDLEVYNTSDAATSGSYSVVLGTDVATITPASPGTISYYGLTEASNNWRTVSFQAGNEGGDTTANQVVKYSTYLVKKLGRVALAAADSQSIDISAIANLAGTPSYPGSANFPPSFADAAAVVADAGVTAAIDTAAKTLDVSAATALTGKKLVRIDAGPDFTINPADYDKGILQVYPNLAANGKFDAGTTNWNVQIYGGASGMGTITIAANYNGKTNVFKAAQVAGQKVQATQIITGLTPGQWYTARAKVATDATDVNATKQKAYLYIMDFPGGVISRSAHDIIQPGFFTVGQWIDMEISMFCQANQIAVQFVSISNAAATLGSSMYWDEIELFQAPPQVEDAELTYGNTAVAIPNGSFDSNISGGWLIQGYAGANPGTASWAASQSGHSGVLQIVQATADKAQSSQNGVLAGALGKSVKLSAFVLTNASAGNGGKFYAYIYSTDTAFAIQKSHAAIIQPGVIGSNAWEEIKVGSIARTDTNCIQICTITGAKAAQTMFVDDVTLAADKDPIYFWDSTLFP